MFCGHTYFTISGIMEEGKQFRYEKEKFNVSRRQALLAPNAKVFLIVIFQLQIDLIAMERNRNCCHWNVGLSTILVPDITSQCQPKMDEQPDQPFNRTVRNHFFLNIIRFGTNVCHAGLMQQWTSELITRKIRTRPSWVVCLRGCLHACSNGNHYFWVIKQGPKLTMFGKQNGLQDPTPRMQTQPSNWIWPGGLFLVDIPM